MSLLSEEPAGGEITLDLILFLVSKPHSFTFTLAISLVYVLQHCQSSLLSVLGCGWSELMLDIM